jgi:ATPase subunit of ABC transporter with duplicated ATPase domains
MPRFFNTTGPCDPARHYYLPTAARLPDLQIYLDRQQYFVLHAPRQTGKTTAMRTLAQELRERGVAACWVTLEAARASRTSSGPSRCGCRRSWRRQRSSLPRGDLRRRNP